MVSEIQAVNLLDAEAETKLSWPQHARIVFQILFLCCGPFVRCALGCASLVWVVMLWWPGNQVFERGAFFLFNLITTEFWLGMAFLVHGIAVWWRLLSRTDRPWLSLIINSYGFILWASMVSAVAWAVPGPVPTLAMDMVACIGALCSIVNNDIKVFKHVGP